MTFSPSSNASARTTRPRVMLLSFNVRYICPTSHLLHAVLSEACDLVAFGPGYVPLDIVAEGPSRFAERHGPFDMIVGDEYTLLRDAIPEDRKHLHKFLFQATTFDPLLIHEGTRYYAFFKSYSGPRIIMLMASDYYNFTADRIEQMEEIGDFFVCWGSELMTSKQSIPQDRVAGQPQNSEIYRRWNDRYFDFLKRNPEKILSTPHFISADEFATKSLIDRRFDWWVVGADYEARVTARELIDRDHKRRSGRALPYIFAAAAKIGFHLYNKFWAIALLNFLFRRSLRAARYGFTCGSALRWPIRKYFEIPANGAVLVAERCTGFEALGFKDRVNAIAAEAPEILDAGRWLDENPERAQAIADRGRMLVENRHSVNARARQFAESFARIKDGTFNGSYWSNGDLHFHPVETGKLD